MSKLSVCPHCAGAGQGWVQDETHAWQKDCEFCHGQGFLRENCRVRKITLEEITQAKDDAVKAFERAIRARTLAKRQPSPDL